MAIQTNRPTKDAQPGPDDVAVTGLRLAYRAPTVISRPLFERMALNCDDKLDAVNSS